MKSEGRKSSYIIAFLVILVIALIAASLIGKNKKGAETEKEEESAGSGLLEIETLPNNADIFVDDEYKGISPTTLYNVPAGQHDIMIKKEGYEDYTISVGIEPGKKAFIEANLVQMQVLEEKEETPEITEEEKTESADEEMSATENTVNIGNRILLYYDFSEKKVTDIRQLESDVFSKRFDTYLVFTRYSPATIKTANKNINTVGIEDCSGAKGQFEYLYSGNSLCIVTKDNQVIALGGEWEKTENAELRWKAFS